MILRKTAYFAVLLFVFVFASCQSNQVDTKLDPSIAAKQVINEHVQMLNAHDLKGLVAQYDSKARITSSDWDGVIFGPQGADQLYYQVFYVSPDAKYLVDNMVVTDSTIVIEYDAVGLKEKFNSTIRFDQRYCSIFKIKNNKIASEATYANPRLYHAK
ncbi:nuclear transport factor 2 family protein [Mucilaginibacter sp.]|uniref:nuclear transport factor 2 family protein n=1 Tax=Mucilaginibacter sp. TaxID=1882438 RepID=UPI0035BC7701